MRSPPLAVIVLLCFFSVARATPADDFDTNEIASQSQFVHIAKDVSPDGEFFAVTVEPQVILYGEHQGRPDDSPSGPWWWGGGRSAPRTTTPRQMDQSITIGSPIFHDSQLVSKVVFRAGTILSVHTEVFDWTDLFNYLRIHCIQIVDLQRDGKNATPTVQRGGLGHRDVSIKFKSTRGGNINYLVVLWGQ